jgi:serine/threonine-protein kinase SRPK3
MKKKIYITNVIDEIEDIDEYRTGGLHPVRLGDTYEGKQKYKILLKLSYGTFSTVWLGRMLNVNPT